jgi:hypothetical protein
LQAKLLVELVNTSAGVYQLLFARVKGVTLGADFDFDIFLRATRFDNLSASALNSRLPVVRVDSFFHYAHLTSVVQNTYGVL